MAISENDKDSFREIGNPLQICCVSDSSAFESIDTSCSEESLLFASSTSNRLPALIYIKAMA